jgi:hypothetical protein
MVKDFDIDVTFEDEIVSFCGENGGCVVYSVKENTVDELVAAFKRYLEIYQEQEEQEEMEYVF